jgi:hypothetical protein
LIAALVYTDEPPTVLILDQVVDLAALIAAIPALIMLLNDAALQAAWRRWDAGLPPIDEP